MKQRKGVILTSIENKTPPMGEPKATATPAALAAVTISRILPRITYIGQIPIMEVEKAYFGSDENYQISQPLKTQYNMQRGRRGLLYRLIDQMR